MALDTCPYTVHVHSVSCSLCYPRPVACPSLAVITGFCPCSVSYPAKRGCLVYSRLTPAIHVAAACPVACPSLAAVTRFGPRSVSRAANGRALSSRASRQPFTLPRMSRCVSQPCGRFTFRSTFGFVRSPRIKLCPLAPHASHSRCRRVSRCVVQPCGHFTFRSMFGFVRSQRMSPILSRLTPAIHVAARVPLRVPALRPFHVSIHVRFRAQPKDQPCPLAPHASHSRCRRVSRCVVQPCGHFTFRSTFGFVRSQRMSPILSRLTPAIHVAARVSLRVPALRPFHVSVHVRLRAQPTDQPCSLTSRHRTAAS
jgi:hypothetical protein